MKTAILSLKYEMPYMRVCYANSIYAKERSMRKQSNQQNKAPILPVTYLFQMLLIASLINYIMNQQGYK